MRWQLSQRGFTLIELMIGLFLTGILMAALFGLLSSSLQSRTQADRHVELQQTARHAMDSMVRDLQYANAITSVSPESITFKTEQFGTDTITYWLDKSRTTAILRQNKNASINQPVTGEGQAVNVSISQLAFEILRTNTAGQPLTIGIELAVTDLAVSDSAKRPDYTLRTAVTGMNIPR
ncbi:hypothetical protein AXX12_02760 [Anaerosporomusa subterranea]|uniref:Prepilin-type N-terminal cleavage/methylation domain-containing protein n=1 Tax=Anaerosporomusa subterranea TaxID=1794912 RepID=A0A154BST1_ANASB|nr:prepilin-type N-terminal cleavage/methylation domain-containing protein [Anaerosporomusa subterranea]KYZ77074.1 hypothetical protein AXX12_02760 [Anaerosporomusa subterranea]